MTEQEMKKTNNEQDTVNVKRLLDVVLSKFWVVIAASILGAAIMLVCTWWFITPQYESSAMFYVNNSSISVGNASLSLSTGDISAAKSLVDSYIVILNARSTLRDVIDYAGVNRTVDDLEDMIEAASINSTEIFEVVVTSPDPMEAENIASAIAYILPKRISTIIEGSSAKIVDTAVIPTKPSSPSYTYNVFFGFLIGMVAAVGVVVVKEIFNTTIRTEEDIALTCHYPVLAEIPDMTAASKGGSYYGYGEKKNKDGKKVQAKDAVLVGPGISFAASESYKLLRTKLQFSFADDNTSRIIGISSALSGEGKSLSSVNLAYSLSELGKRVILLDCDMRRPTLAKKLPVKKAPGLSSYLTGQSDLVSLIQPCGIPEDENAFHVVSAGQNPPNPIELLSSRRMETGLNALRKIYDYVILDLPPVSEVSDAMAIAGQTDGTLLVVRQNYCDRIILGDTVRQFEYVNAKILGVVFNGTTESTGKYGKNYYKKYYNKNYERSAAAAKEARR